MEMAIKNFIVSFERGSETIYTPFTPALCRKKFWLEILGCSPSWIFVDMHDTSQVGSRNFIFLRDDD